jgi:hypothetical protein
MNKHAALLTLSILIILIPLLGFPGSWKSLFTIILALISAILSYRLYRQDVARNPKVKSEEKMNAYVDNLHSNN